MSKTNYGLRDEIVDKLFNGVVMPTAIEQGYTLKDMNKVNKMMQGLATKYHSMSKTQRKMLISVAEEKIEEKLRKMEAKNEDA